jgi:hypothetical protein
MPAKKIEMASSAMLAELSLMPKRPLAIAARIAGCLNRANRRDTVGAVGVNGLRWATGVAWFLGKGKGLFRLDVADSLLLLLARLLE